MPPRPPVLPAFPAVPPRPAALARRQSLVYWPPVFAAGVFAVLLVVGAVAWASTHPGARKPAPAPAAPTPEEVAAPQPAAPAEPARAAARPKAEPEAFASAPPRARRVAVKPPAPPPPAAPQPKPAAEAPASGEKYGTAVTLLANPAEASRRADKEGKLLLVLHVSGNFEDECFT